MKHLIKTRGLWWKKDGQGYTSDILEAGVFTDERSFERLKNGKDRGEGTVDTAVPLGDVIGEITERRAHLKRLCAEAVNTFGIAETPRERMVTLIGGLDDEAFSWLAICCLSSQKSMRPGLWPDGLGGFKDREAIEALREAAAKYVESVG